MPTCADGGKVGGAQDVDAMRHRRTTDPFLERRTGSTSDSHVAVERGGDNEALGYRHSEHMRRVARTCERPQDVAARITHTCACGACGATNVKHEARECPVHHSYVDGHRRATDALGQRQKHAVPRILGHAMQVNAPQCLGCLLTERACFVQAIWHRVRQNMLREHGQQCLEDLRAPCVREARGNARRALSRTVAHA